MPKTQRAPKELLATIAVSFRSITRRQNTNVAPVTEMLMVASGVRRTTNTIKIQLAGDIANVSHWNSILS